MTDEEIIAVVTAHKEGKTIEVSVNYADDWGITRSPVWDFEKYNYRVKPEPHYRPFESAEEVMEAIKEHGSWIRRKNTSSLHNIIRLNPKELALCDVTIYGAVESVGYESFNECLDKGYTFADGTPFGKLVEE